MIFESCAKQSRAKSSILQLLHTFTIFYKLCQACQIVLKCTGKFQQFLVCNPGRGCRSSTYAQELALQVMKAMMLHDFSQAPWLPSYWSVARNKPLHAFTIWISCHPFASDVKSLAIVLIVFRLSSLKTPPPRQSFASKLPSKAFSEGAPLSTAKRSLKAPMLPTMAWHQWHQHINAFFYVFYGVLHRASRASPCLESL